LYRSGKYERALEAFTGAVPQPAADRASYWLSLTSRALARETLLEEVRSARESFRVHLLLGDLAKSSGDNAAARVEYEKAAGSAPADASVQLLVVRFLAAQDPSAALNRARAAVRTLPGDPSLNVELGKLLLKQGAPQEAAMHFRTALKTDGKLAAARAGLAEAFAAAGDLAKAIGEMEPVVNADPDGSWHYRLGTWYRAAGRAAEAREAFAVTARLKAEQLAREEARFLALTSAPDRKPAVGEAGR
jgi:Tfp pilus assembly protein PilF